MAAIYQNLIKKVYKEFNARNIDEVLLHMHTDVHWPNGWEGGYVNGHDEVRDYWTRQWKELDPHVEPVSINETEDGKVEVDVHQLVKDIKGNILSDGMVKHVYTIGNNLIIKMEIQKP